MLTDGSGLSLQQVHHVAAVHIASFVPFFELV
jgi:hypothetical protein